MRISDWSSDVCSSDLIISSTMSFAAAQVAGSAAPSPFVGMSDRPAAQLKLYGSREFASTWSGSGPNVVKADLCVASTTGRFRLKIASAGGGRMVAIGSRERINYTVRFRDGSSLDRKSVV